MKKASSENNEFISKSDRREKIIVNIKHKSKPTFNSKIREGDKLKIPRRGKPCLMNKRTVDEDMVDIFHTRAVDRAREIIGRKEKAKSTFARVDIIKDFPE